ncbi:phosphatase PAP2 family protein [Stomatohabitans albus]|uniref:phosphatase PAP2 family protein n=1 Tax=Stomatohabitans albus TaxID=3110766 RepID=UPI00300BFE95
MALRESLNLHYVDRADRAVGRTIRAVQRFAPVTVAMRRTTDWGSLYTAIGAAVLLHSQGRPRTAVKLLSTGLVGWELGSWLKTRTQRPRPYENDNAFRLINPPMGSSMPSGHAITSAAMATVSAAHTRPSRRWIWAILPAWVGLTRVGLGVHHPADIAAGWAVGFWLGTVINAADRSIPGTTQA